MTGSRIRGWVRENTLATTAVLTLVSYALVIGTFLLDIGVYPSLSHGQVNLFTHAIAVINSITIGVLLLGLYWIKQGSVKRHRNAMLVAVVLICLFLLLYLVRVGGGGEKYITDVSPLVRSVYRGMLGIHIVLSILAVPLVIYAVLLGLTRTIPELRRSVHPTVGRIAIATWLLSLFLGVVTYFMLNHVYTYRFPNWITVIEFL